MATKKKKEAECLELDETMRALGAPPRKISWWVQLRLMLGELARVRIIGWVLVCAVMLFLCAAFARPHGTDVDENLWRDAGAGTLVTIDVDTCFGGTNVTAYHYVFQYTNSEGEAVEADCMSIGKKMVSESGAALGEGATVNLERQEKSGAYRMKETFALGKAASKDYAKSQPMVEETGTHSWLSIVHFLLKHGFFVLLVLGVIVLDFYYSLYWYRRLFAYGEIGKAAVQNLGTQYSKSGIPLTQHVTYRFHAADGAYHEVAGNISPGLDLSDREELIILYDSEKPQRILPLAMLPKGISLDDETGEFRLKSSGTYVYTVMMAVANLLFLVIFTVELGIFLGLWAW